RIGYVLPYPLRPTFPHAQIIYRRAWYVSPDVVADAASVARTDSARTCRLHGLVAHRKFPSGRSIRRSDDVNDLRLMAHWKCVWGRRTRFDSANRPLYRCSRHCNGESSNEPVATYGADLGIVVDGDGMAIHRVDSHDHG